MKLFKLSIGLLMVIFFAVACNTEPAKVETIHITTPAPEKVKAEETAKEDIQVKVDEKGVEFKYEKKD
jgi:hypothetical protein